MNIPALASAAHILFFVLMITGVLWIKWVGMLLIFAALRIQDKILGGCILTKLEFGTYKARWSTKYLPESWNISPTKWKYFADWVFPSILIVLAYTIQG